MKLLIAGSRSITDVDIGKYIPEGVDMILTGGAAGVDTLAEQYAVMRKISRLVLLPRYDLYGKAAPIKRNDEMADLCDEGLIIWDGKSKGTKHTMNYLKKLGKKVTLVNTTNSEPKPPDYAALITKNIKDLCERRNMTYYRLAKDSDIPHSTLSAAINKQEIPSMKNFLKICHGFEMTPAEFFMMIENPAEKSNELTDLWVRLDDRSKKLASAYLFGLVKESVK